MCFICIGYDILFLFFCINGHVTSIFNNNQHNKLYYYLLYLFWLRFLTSLICVCVACFRTAIDISYLSILEYKKIINIKISFLYSDVKRRKKWFLISKSERRVYNFHERVKYVFFVHVLCFLYVINKFLVWTVS